jgi:hypothetical protein
VGGQDVVTSAEGLPLFGGVLVLAFASVALPAGPMRVGWFVAALCLTASVVVVPWATRWTRMPEWWPTSTFPAGSRG